MLSRRCKFRSGRSVTSWWERGGHVEVEGVANFGGDGCGMLLRRGGMLRQRECDTLVCRVNILGGRGHVGWGGHFGAEGAWRTRVEKCGMSVSPSPSPPHLASKRNGVQPTFTTPIQFLRRTTPAHDFSTPLQHTTSVFTAIIRLLFGKKTFSTFSPSTLSWSRRVVIYSTIARPPVSNLPTPPV